MFPSLLIVYPPDTLSGRPLKDHFVTVLNCGVTLETQIKSTYVPSIRFPSFET